MLYSIRRDKRGELFIIGSHITLTESYFIANFSFLLREVKIYNLEELIAIALNYSDNRKVKNICYTLEYSNTWLRDEKIRKLYIKEEK